MQDDDHGSYIAWVHLAIQGFLEAGIPDQHEATGCKVVIPDLGGVLAREAVHMGYVGHMYTLSKFVEIRLSLGKLLAMMREEIFIR